MPQPTHPNCPHCNQPMKYLAGHLGGRGPGGSWCCDNEECEKINLCSHCGQKVSHFPNDYCTVMKSTLMNNMPYTVRRRRNAKL